MASRSLPPPQSVPLVVQQAANVAKTPAEQLRFPPGSPPTMETLIKKKDHYKDGCRILHEQLRVAIAYCEFLHSQAAINNQSICNKALADPTLLFSAESMEQDVKEQLESMMESMQAMTISTLEKKSAIAPQVFGKLQKQIAAARVSISALRPLLVQLSVARRMEQSIADLIREKKVKILAKEELKKKKQADKAEIAALKAKQKEQQLLGQLAEVKAMKCPLLAAPMQNPMLMGPSSSSSSSSSSSLVPAKKKANPNKWVEGKDYSGKEYGDGFWQDQVGIEDGSFAHQLGPARLTSAFGPVAPPKMNPSLEELIAKWEAVGTLDDDEEAIECDEEEDVGEEEPSDSEEL